MSEPITREEKYLARMAGEWDDELPKPITRSDKYLDKIARNGGGGGGGTGTDNYNLLQNKPQINGVTLRDNVSLDTLGIASKTALDKKVEQETGKGLSTNDYDDTEKAEVAKIKDKVDKADGKGLSTNDFTDEDKEAIKNLKTVATTGSYNDLTDTPSIPNVVDYYDSEDDMEALSGIAVKQAMESYNTNVLSKEYGTVSNISAGFEAVHTRLNKLSSVAESGSYNDLSDKPTLGTQVTFSLSGTTLTITSK